MNFTDCNHFSTSLSYWNITTYMHLFFGLHHYLIKKSDHDTLPACDVQIDGQRELPWLIQRSALLTIQSDVLATAIPSVSPSVRLSVCPTHAGIVPRQMKIGYTRSLLWGSTNTLVSWHENWLGSDLPFHVKFALKVIHPRWKAPTSTNICL